MKIMTAHAQMERLQYLYPDLQIGLEKHAGDEWAVTIQWEESEDGLMGSYQKVSEIDEVVETIEGPHPSQLA